LFLTGIILHVTGAYFALMAASKLETDLNHLNAELKYLSDSKLRDDVFNGLTTLARRFVKPHYYDEEGASARRRGNRDPMFCHLPLERLCRSVRRHQVSGKLGSYAIALGFLACLAGLGCLAYEYDRKAMRVAASVVIFVLLLVRFVFLFIHRKMSDLRSWWKSGPFINMLKDQRLDKVESIRINENGPKNSMVVQGKTSTDASPSMTMAVNATASANNMKVALRISTKDDAPYLS
jgi:hypothetical protein